MFKNCLNKVLLLNPSISRTHCSSFPFQICTKRTKQLANIYLLPSGTMLGRIHSLLPVDGFLVIVMLDTHRMTFNSLHIQISFAHCLLLLLSTFCSLFGTTELQNKYACPVFKMTVFRECGVCNTSLPSCTCCYRELLSISLICYTIVWAL